MSNKERDAGSSTSTLQRNPTAGRTQADAEHVEEMIDDAVEMTFPASDAPATTGGVTRIENGREQGAGSTTPKASPGHNR